MKLIADWKQTWRYYSVIGMALVASLPDLVSLIMNSGLVEQPAMVRYMQLVAVASLIGRHIDQTVKEAKAKAAVESMEYPPDDSGR